MVLLLQYQVNADDVKSAKEGNMLGLLILHLYQHVILALKYWDCCLSFGWRLHHNIYYILAVIYMYIMYITAGTGNLFSGTICYICWNSLYILIAIYKSNAWTQKWTEIRYLWLLQHCNKHGQSFHSPTYLSAYAMEMCFGGRPWRGGGFCWLLSTSRCSPTLPSPALIVRHRFDSVRSVSGRLVPACPCTHNHLCRVDFFYFFYFFY